MRTRLFGNHTGLRVSELILGTGNFGTRWGHGAERDEARRIFDGYLEAGGNFIDTADAYQFGESESFLGEFIQPHREQLVVASKFTLGAAPRAVTGNNRKSMIQALEQTLKRLGTDRVDLYWVHMPDGLTPVDEIVRALDDLVRAGKILYAGLSDFPAWRVARAATLAELRGWTRIAGLQLEYSLVERTAERELLPMARAFGIGVAGWSPLGGGVLTGKYRRGETGRQTGLGGRLFHPEDTPRKTMILDLLEHIATQHGATPSQIAIAWVAANGILPILGPRSRAQLDDNLAATRIELTAEQLRLLDEVSAIPLGFPHDFLAAPSNQQRLVGEVGLPLQPVA